MKKVVFWFLFHNESDKATGFKHKSREPSRLSDSLP